MSEKKKVRQIKLPKKRTINLAADLEVRTNWAIAIPAIILICIGAAMLSKFAVVDRYEAVRRASENVANMHTQLELLNIQYENYSGLAEEYGHYTLAGLTDAEKQYFNRNTVIHLIENTIMRRVTVGEWTIRENVLTIPMKARTLEQIKNTVSAVEQESIVNYCEINNAVTTPATEETPEYVTANITINLNDAEEVSVDEAP